jgi:hypothetical protein
MVISWPKQTTTRATHLLRFALKTASLEYDRINDDHYNRIITIPIA